MTELNELFSCKNLIWQHSGREKLYRDCSEVQTILPWSY